MSLSPYNPTPNPPKLLQLRARIRNQKNSQLPAKLVPELIYLWSATGRGLPVRHKRLYLLP